MKVLSSICNFNRGNRSIGDFHTGDVKASDSDKSFNKVNHRCGKFYTRCANALICLKLLMGFNYINTHSCGNVHTMVLKHQIQFAVTTEETTTVEIFTPSL